MDKKVMIYSNEHHAWWKPDYCGYTIYKDRAGIFDYDDAIKHYPRMNYDRSEEDYFIDIDENDKAFYVDLRSGYYYDIIEHLVEELQKFEEVKVIK